MTINMDKEDVLSEILQLSRSGADIDKKIVKKFHPTLMRNALHYFSNWENAVKNSQSF
ncbi:hypothetical protein [Anaerobacillus alkalilacustris]|uniref:hypothetical protein n=1 Tax=Anaerobacillus alkalilacustris TaxID=393763 RepID=UPI001471FCEA|nr:hypothetical protein [Anaerobacillus alkalilacustris]